jgi:hypothetical protein
LDTQGEGRALGCGRRLGDRAPGHEGWGQETNKMRMARTGSVMIALAVVAPACGDGVESRDEGALLQPAEAEPRDLNEAFDLA